eukprot:885079-Prymnesium_polylepis.1
MDTFVPGGGVPLRRPGGRVEHLLLRLRRRDLPPLGRGAEALAEVFHLLLGLHRGRHPLHRLPLPPGDRDAADASLLQLAPLEHRRATRAARGAEGRADEVARPIGFDRDGLAADDDDEIEREPDLPDLLSVSVAEHRHRLRHLPLEVGRAAAPLGLCLRLPLGTLRHVRRQARPVRTARLADPPVPLQERGELGSDDG